MYISDQDPMDVPAPPTVDEVAASFCVPLMGFVPQPALTEVGVGSVGHSSDGGCVELESVSISYTLWRNPGDRADPLNFLELSDEQRTALDTPPPRPLPEWLMRMRELMRYPALWEAVMTTRKADARPGAAAAPTSTNTRSESTLVAHVNHVITNAFHDERVTGEFPGELDLPVDERHIEQVDVVVDGVPVAGMRIDTDPHVYAVGADLGDRVLTAVIAREYLAYVRMEFATQYPRA
jgi:hypothetical protein